MSRRLTLNQERRMIAELHAIALELPAAEFERVMADRMGVAAADQLKAATAEAGTLITGLKEPLNLPYEGRAEKRELKVNVLAGVLRCFAAGAHCEHAVGGGTPLYALLGARVVACRRCLLLPRYARRIKAADERNTRKVGDGRLCDFCLQEPDDFWFHRTAVHFGPTVVLGSMCRDCWQLSEHDQETES